MGWSFAPAKESLCERPVYAMLSRATVAVATLTEVWF
ncbi:hypothetical protein GGD83_002783 [Rhodoblastus sphagnicola]|nr:hypothetical protein [Rhodoblastus sphagnicola]